MSHSTRSYLVVFGACAAAVLATAQLPTASFEVASVKPHDWSNKAPYHPGVTITGNTVTIPNVWLKRLITTAYDIKDYQVEGGPKWIDGRPREFNFDLAAKTKGETPATVAQTHQMLQTLLVDRFKLRFHREVRDIPVYVLVAGKGDLKLKPIPPAESFEKPGETLEIKGGAATVRMKTGKMIMGKNCDMAGFVLVLNGETDRPVIDETGLKGLYNIRMEYADGD